MSPSEALVSDVFRTYVAILAGLLLAVGAAIGVLRFGLNKDVGHAWKAYRGWLVMIPAVLGCLFLGRLATIGLFTLLSLAGFKEYARATGLNRDWLMTGAVYLAIFAVGTLSAIDDPTYGTRGWYGLFIALPVFVVAVLMFIPILRNRAAGQLQVLALAILGFVYIGWMFGHLSFMANATNAYGYLFYVLFAVELNDVAAFTFGRLFGRHPLRSNISPKKTWEGALGALAVSLVLPWIMHFSFPYFGPAACAYRSDRGHRRSTRRPLDQRHQARCRCERHGHRHPRPRRHPRPDRQPDLRRPAILSHGWLLPRFVLTSEFR